MKKYIKSAKVSQFNAHNDRWVNECWELWSVNKFYINLEYYLIAHTWFLVFVKKIIQKFVFFFIILESKTKKMRNYLLSLLIESIWP